MKLNRFFWSLIMMDLVLIVFVSAFLVPNEQIAVKLVPPLLDLTNFEEELNIFESELPSKES